MTSYTYTFVWYVQLPQLSFTNNRRLQKNATSNIDSVYVTGNFDNWLKTTALSQDDDGSFSRQVKLPSKDKIVFKFVVNDNEWVTSDDYKIEYDENGMQNNYVDAEELIQMQEFEQEPEPEVEQKSEQPEIEPIVVDSGDSALPDPDSAGEIKSDGDSDPKKSDLTQVSTGSSFAAVSIPGSSGESTFEHVDDQARHISPPTKEEGIHTPTQSVYDTEGRAGDASTITSINMSSSPSNVVDKEVRPAKRDLLTKFKGFFRS